MQNINKRSDWMSIIFGRVSSSVIFVNENENENENDQQFVHENEN